MQATRGSWVSLKIGRPSLERAMHPPTKRSSTKSSIIEMPTLRRLAAGFRPYRDEIADARHRFADASGILDQNPDIHGRKRPSDVTTSN